MRSRFKDDAIYTIEGRRLRRLEEISALLNQPGTLTFDQRRDAANMIDLALSEAVEFIP